MKKCMFKKSTKNIIPNTVFINAHTVNQAHFRTRLPNEHVLQKETMCHHFTITDSLIIKLIKKYACFKTNTILHVHSRDSYTNLTVTTVSMALHCAYKLNQMKQTKWKRSANIINIIKGQWSTENRPCNSCMWAWYIWVIQETIVCNRSYQKQPIDAHSSRVNSSYSSHMITSWKSHHQASPNQLYGRAMHM